MRDMERRCAGTVVATGLAGGEIGEDLRDDFGSFDARDDVQRAATHATVFDIDAEDSLEPLHPAHGRTTRLRAQSDLSARRRVHGGDFETIGPLVEQAASYHVDHAVLTVGGNRRRERTHELRGREPQAGGWGLRGGIRGLHVHAGRDRADGPGPHARRSGEACARGRRADNAGGRNRAREHSQRASARAHRTGACGCVDVCTDGRRRCGPGMFTGAGDDSQAVGVRSRVGLPLVNIVVVSARLFTASPTGSAVPPSVTPS